MQRPPSRSQQGVAAVELALVLMLLCTLLFGTVEIGRALYHYHTLVKSVRAASRYLVSTPPTDPTPGSASYQAWLSAGRCVAVYGRPDCSGSPLLPGLALSQVTVREPASDSGMRHIKVDNKNTMSLLSVSIVGYQFTPVVAFVVPALRFGNITAVIPHG